MTARDKANELYSKYDDLLNKDFGNPIVFDNQIKQCALIAVDEIDLLLQNSTPKDDPYANLASLEYWQEVKHEIENL